MTSPLRILFLGTSPFAVPSLETLAGDPHFQVDAVITQPDRPAGRKQIVTPPPVKEEALALGLPIHQPENLKRAFAALNLPRPDFLVVVSYGQILSSEILDFPTVAPVNVHASLLPRFRGASPIQHALLAGDAETGVTVQRMVRELDAGPVLAQAKIAVEPRDTAAALHDRLAAAGAALLRDTLLAPLRPVPQDEENATVCRKLTRADGLVDPRTMTAEDIDRRVRALTPWPGISFFDGGTSVKILQASLAAQEGASPLPCAQGSILYLVTVQPAGRKPMSGDAWARGRKTR